MTAQLGGIIIIIFILAGLFLFVQRLLPASLWSTLTAFAHRLPLMKLQRCLCSWQVDVKNQGKTALQVAAHQGHMEVVKALLQANSSVEVKDEDGDTALHYTAFGWGCTPVLQMFWQMQRSYLFLLDTFVLVLIFIFHQCDNLHIPKLNLSQHLFKWRHYCHMLLSIKAKLHSHAFVCLFLIGLFLF